MDRAVQRQWRRRLVRGRWQRRRRSKGRRRLLRSRRLRLLPLLSKGMKSAEGALLTATATHPPPPPLSPQDRAQRLGNPMPAACLAFIFAVSFSSRRFSRRRTSSRESLLSSCMGL